MEARRYGVTEAGEPVDVFVLEGASGLRARVFSLGCIIAGLEVPNREGRLANVVLGLDSLTGYQARSPHFGVIAGRYANRIARGRFAIDGTEYQLPPNDGPNVLHGGRHGFDKVVWRAELGGDDVVVLRHPSPDGDQGFPGALAVEVRHSVGPGDELRVDYAATTDRPTIVNLTNHSYFNLRGERSGDVLGHVVSIEADQFTPTDGIQIPTGEIRAVRATPFDFTRPTAIGERSRQADEQLLIARL